MKQVVCMKITPKVDQIKFDEARKTIIREGVENEINEADKNALEMALSIKEKQGGTVIVLSMGPPSFESHLKLAIAMGADDGVLLSDRSFGGADTFATSRVLAEGIKKISGVDLVLCGEASSDGSTEQVPASIAAWLGFPQVSYSNSVEIESGKLKAKSSLDGGYQIVQSQLPALVSVELGSNTPRFPDFRRKRWAEKEFKLTVWGMNDLAMNQADAGTLGSRTVVKETRSLATRQRAKESITGSPQEIAKRLAEIIQTRIAS